MPRPTPRMNGLIEINIPLHLVVNLTQPNETQNTHVNTFGTIGEPGWIRPRNSKKDLIDLYFSYTNKCRPVLSGNSGQDYCSPGSLKYNIFFLNIYIYIKNIF